MNTRLRYRADNLVELLGPTDSGVDPAAPIVAITSCTAKLYADLADTVTQALTVRTKQKAEENAPTLFLDSVADLVVGEVLDFLQPDGVPRSFTISTIDTGAVSVDVVAPLAVELTVNQELTRKTHGATNTRLLVERPSNFEVGDTAEVRLDDGTTVERTVNAIDGRSLTLSAAAGVVSGNRRVSRKLGADVAMAGFNLAAATADADDWGYRGAILPTHAGLRSGMRVRIEVELVDGSGGVLRDHSRSTVIGDG